MSYRIKNELDSDREFRARYKGYWVSVEWQGSTERELEMDDFVDHNGFDEDGWIDYQSRGDTGPEDGMAWYINVYNPEKSFGTAYDGWWGDADDTLEEAVEEALIGSLLITKDQRRFRLRSAA